MGQQLSALCANLVHPAPKPLHGTATQHTHRSESTEQPQKLAEWLAAYLFQPEICTYTCSLVSEANNMDKTMRNTPIMHDCSLDYKSKEKRKQERGWTIENTAFLWEAGRHEPEEFQNLKRTRRRRRRPTSVTEECHPSGVSFFFSPFLHISCDLKLVLFCE